MTRIGTLPGVSSIRASDPTADDRGKCPRGAFDTWSRGGSQERFLDFTSILVCKLLASAHNCFQLNKLTPTRNDLQPLVNHWPGRRRPDQSIAQRRARATDGGLRVRRKREREIRRSAGRTSGLDCGSESPRCSPTCGGKTAPRSAPASDLASPPTILLLPRRPILACWGRRGRLPKTPVLPAALPRPGK